MAITINIPSGVTASSSTTAVWNNLLTRQSVLNSDNPNYLRSFQINNGYLVLTKGTSIAGISLGSIIPLLIALVPALTWPPVITLQPPDRTIASGDNTTFPITATSEISITYQWQLSTDSGANWSNVTDGGIYSGATTATLTLTAASGITGNQYRCMATNASGSTNSSAGILTLT